MPRAHNKSMDGNLGLRDASEVLSKGMWGQIGCGSQRKQCSEMASAF